MTSGTETKQGKMDRRKSTVNPQKDPQAAMEEPSRSSTTLVNVCLLVLVCLPPAGKLTSNRNYNQEKGKASMHRSDRRARRRERDGRPTQHRALNRGERKAPRARRRLRIIQNECQHDRLFSY
ncbi:hypothetical protein GWK47_029773 [Chionoecetes opilio]|uniref:Uncharacterized protein n=1 Tax=Chionoecetes opilio TaxID=41210 RepID=A0A8J4YW93_CHIOP|nr:hypothetical protein GWK47_029773 [Chionoecetes opilio]